ncbi:MAG TPA: hypothetical protein V6D00_11510 [Pantanalinema sp.]
MLSSIVLAAGLLAKTIDIPLPTKNDVFQELVGDGKKVWHHVGSRVFWGPGGNCNKSIQFRRDGTCEMQACLDGKPIKTQGKWIIGAKGALDWTVLIDGNPYLVQARKDSRSEYLIISKPAPAGGKNVDEFYKHESQ